MSDCGISCQVSGASHQGKEKSSCITADLERTPPNEQLCCDASIEKRPEPKIEEVLNGLAQGILPGSVLKSLPVPHIEDGVVIIDGGGKVKPNRGLELELFPEWFRAFHSETRSALSELAVRFVKTVRWVQSAAGSQSPFATVGFYWSLDKNEWRSMPSELRVMIDVPCLIRADSEAFEEISNVWRGDHREPLAHELIREALDICPRTGERYWICCRAPWTAN